MSSDAVRKVLLFTFYGLYEHVTKNKKNRITTKLKPVHDWIRRKTACGRTRFTTKVDRNFADFINLFKMPDNNAKWKELLTDGGEGEAPIEYIVNFEAGLRNFRDDVHSMGTRPLRSPHYWSTVDQWRKREAYIALARKLLGLINDYRQWDCFLWSDYTLRQKLTKTFNKRHLPVSDGDDEKHFKGQYNFDWSECVYSPRKKKARVQTPRKHSTPASADTVAPTAPSQMMIYDVEKDCLVPI